MYIKLQDEKLLTLHTVSQYCELTTKLWTKRTLALGNRDIIVFSPLYSTIKPAFKNAFIRTFLQISIGLFLHA